MAGEHVWVKDRAGLVSMRATPISMSAREMTGMMDLPVNPMMRLKAAEYVASHVLM